MKTQRNMPRKAVSFTLFRRLQLTAVQRLWSYLWNHNSVEPHTHFLIWALVTALQEARYADAVALARQLSEQQYGDAGSFRLGAQIVALVKKVPFLDPSLDPELAALKKFLQAEQDCCAVNEVIRPYRMLLNGCIMGEVDKENFVEPLLRKARGHIRRVLGSKPPLDDILHKARFGSGSSVGVHGSSTHFLRKITSETWTVSTLCLPFAAAAAAKHPAFWYVLGLEPQKARHLWKDPMQYYLTNWSFKEPPVSRLTEEFLFRFKARVEVVNDDLITYVPKDADCHRTVGTQPLLNMFCQLGVGDYLKDVLRDRCGIVLEEDQESVNGPLALLGSFCDGTGLSTIDLASASDTISKELVKFLLPTDWYTLMNSLRTPNYRLPGEEDSHPYEKFCAMGNGFCFPLETLIFWSLCQAVYDVVETPDRLMAVYGDDIIVYQPAALLLIELLEQAGFSTNIGKTFVFGPFRESCGQDYFNGVNVRPTVLDEIIEGFGQVYHFINSLRRKGYTALADELRSLLPAGLIHMRPFPGDTTTALEVEWDTFMTCRHARFHSKAPRDERVPFFNSWSWEELLTQAVMDEKVYDRRAHFSAALSGAEARKPQDRIQSSGDGFPQYAFRRKTRVRVRRVAHA